LKKMPGAKIFTRIYEKMEQAVAQGIFPGAVIWIGHQGQCLHHSAHGRVSFPKGRKTKLETIFDLSSLNATKKQP